MNLKSWELESHMSEQRLVEEDIDTTRLHLTSNKASFTCIAFYQT